MNVLDEKFVHPRAYLTKKRNMKIGLEKRTVILNTLEKGNKTAKEIASETNLSYQNILYHIRNLKSERIINITKENRKPHIWLLTGLGQQKINNSTYPS